MAIQKATINRAADVELDGYDIITVERIPKKNATSASIRFDIKPEDDPYSKAIVRNVYVGKIGFEPFMADPNEVEDVLVIVAIPAGKYATKAPTLTEQDRKDLARRDPTTGLVSGK